MDPLELGKLIILLGGLMGIYLKINQFMRAASGRGDAREISNDPLKVQETVRAATIHDVERVEKRVDRIERDMKESKRDDEKWRLKHHDDMTAMRDHMDDKLSVIQDEMREISRAVGRLEGS